MLGYFLEIYYIKLKLKNKENKKNLKFYLLDINFKIIHETDFYEKNQKSLKIMLTFY